MRDESPRAIRQVVADILEQEGDVELGYVFGSAAMGALNPTSDVDVAVGIREPGAGLSYFARLAQLSERLEAALGRPVDVIDLFQAPPLLVHEILRTGRPAVVIRHRERWLAFEAQSRRRYWDAQRLWAQYDRHTFR